MAKVIFDPILGKLRTSDASGDGFNRGFFASAELLQQQSGKDGEYAIVGETDTVWVWDSDSNSWKDTGSQTPDLSSYASKTYVNTLFNTMSNDVYRKNEIDKKFNAVYSKTEIDEKIGNIESLLAEV